MERSAVAIVSGGLDSTTLAYLLKKEGYTLTLLSFDYGQRHRKELQFAQIVAQNLEAKHYIVPVTIPLPGTALTDSAVEVPHGHYAAESMRSTVVPNRNAIMLALAFGVASAMRAELVAYAAHGGDHFIYPDCRPTFVEAFMQMEEKALGEACFIPRLYAPFLKLSKADVVSIGANLGVPFENTWSCYEGGAVHCGRCGTCCERQEAFTLAKVPDPTIYQEV